MKEYIVIKPNHASGMFSFIWETLKIIKLNLNNKLYIDFSESIYKKNNKDNVWDYFFEQPYINQRPEIQQITNEIDTLSGYVDRMCLTSQELCNSVQYHFSELKEKNINLAIRRKEYNEIIKKYCVLKPYIQNKIQNFYYENLYNKKILGVHLRGTDHPQKLNSQKYFEQIEKYIDLYDVLYLSTDELERYNTIKARYGSKVVAYDSLKSPSSTPLHHCRPHIGEQAFQTGEDVIIESYLLAKSNFLLCLPHSNVNYYSIYCNLDLQYTTYTE